MRFAIYAAALSAVVLAFLGCDKGSKPPPAPGASSRPATRSAAPPGRGTRVRPIAASAPIGPLEDKPSYTLTRDLTLWRIGELRYGNAHYSQLILLYNRLKDARQLPAGQVVRTPDLKTLLTDEKLYPLMADEANALLAARTSFMGVEGELWEARKAPRGSPAPAAPEAGAEGTSRPATRPSRGSLIPMTPEVKQALLAAAGNVDKAVAGFGRKKPGMTAVPAKAVGQMRAVAASLRGLAAGKCDENGYDIDRVHQRLVFALSDAIQWARRLQVNAGVAVSRDRDATTTFSLGDSLSGERGTGYNSSLGDPTMSGRVGHRKRLICVSAVNLRNLYLTGHR